jgi:hypothetical protein
MNELTELQQAILHTKREHPDWAASDVADAVGCSTSYASDVLSEYDTARLSKVDGEPATAADVEPPASQSDSSGGTGGLTGEQKIFLILLLAMLYWLGVQNNIFPPLGESVSRLSSITFAILRSKRTSVLTS